MEGARHVHLLPGRLASDQGHLLLRGRHGPRAGPARLPPRSPGSRVRHAAVPHHPTDGLGAPSLPVYLEGCGLIGAAVMPRPSALTARTMARATASTRLSLVRSLGMGGQTLKVVPPSGQEVTSTVPTCSPRALAPW